MKFYVIIKYIFMTLFGFSLTLILIPILLPFFLFFGFICFLAQIIIKIKYGMKTRKAEGTDVVHGKVTINTNPIINIALRVKGKLDKEILCEKTLSLINDKLNTKGEKKYKKLTEIYSRAFGYSIWKPFDNFCIENHVNEISLDDVYGTHKNIDKEKEKCQNNKTLTMNKTFKAEKPKCNEKWEDLVKLILEKYGMKFFDENKPRWEILFVKNDNDSYTLLYRFHHAISDGVYISRMFFEDMADVPYFLFDKYKPPHPVIRFLTNVWSFFLLPFGLWKIVSRHDLNPLHGKRLSGKKKFFVSEKISMETLRKIQTNSSFKVSVNSIVFSCISYALAKHFQRKNQIIPTVTALTPIPMQNKTHPNKLQNKFGVGIISFPVSLTMANPTSKESNNKGEKLSLRRLELVKKSLNELANDISILTMTTVINAVCSILPTAIADKLLSTSGCTFLISYLPGAKVKQKIYDCEVLDYMFWTSDREPMGLGISINSYNGSLRVGFIIDDALIKSDQDSYLMLENFQSEVSNLLSETQADTKKKNE